MKLKFLKNQKGSLLLIGLIFLMNVRMAKTVYVFFLLFSLICFIFAAESPMPVEFLKNTQAFFARNTIQEAIHVQGADRTIGIDSMETMASFLWVFLKKLLKTFSDFNWRRFHFIQNKIRQQRPSNFKT
jgi:hypothetical protein